jgi:hypothetical protein
MGYHVEFGKVIGQVDGIGPFWKQIDHRCTMEQKIAHLDPAFKLRFLTIEQNDEVETVAFALLDALTQSFDTEEQKPLGKGEIFMKQSVAVERAGTRR